MRLFAALCLLASVGCSQTQLAARSVEKQPAPAPFARVRSGPTPSLAADVALSHAHERVVSAQRTAIEAVPAPAQRACVLASKHWSGGLQVGSGGPVYGFVSDGAVSLSLGADTRDGSAFTEAGSQHLRLVGVIDQPPIFTKLPTKLSAFVIPLATTSLAWQPTGEVGRVGVALDISDAFEVPAVVESTVRCDKLTIDEPSYDALAFVAPKSTHRAIVGGGVDLFSSPGLAPIARTKQGSFRDALVIAQSGRHTRVVIEAGTYYAIGWVPSEALGEIGMLPLGIGRGMSGGYASSSHRQACNNDLELIAEVGGTRAIVGTLRAGGQYISSTLDIEQGFAALTLFEEWFHPAPNAKLLVRTSDLAACRG